MINITKNKLRINTGCFVFWEFCKYMGKTQLQVKGSVVRDWVQERKWGRGK